MNQIKVKILVACHKPDTVYSDDVYIPIHVGRAVSKFKEEMTYMIGDDTGDNISKKNPYYCELTAQYWAWKNDNADYYGFFHYRRYFSFDPNLNRDDGWGNIAYDRITEDVIKELHLNSDEMSKLITQYDIISVKGRKYPRIRDEGKLLDVYHEYGKDPFQHREDLDKTLKIVLNKYPKYKKAVDTYMCDNIAYECNMFIMKRELYQDYCTWLFDILGEVEHQIDMTWYSVREYRVMGYLAERLYGIYYTHLKENKDIRRLELPKTLFHNTEPEQILKPVYKECIPIVLSANDQFSPYLGVMVKSIIENASSDRNYDLIVLFNDISEKNRKLILGMAKNKKNISIRFEQVCQYFDKYKLSVTYHLSVETYYRLIIPEIMPDYEKVLYLDADMVTDADLAHLYDIDISRYMIAAAKDIESAGRVKIDKDWNNYIKNELKISSVFDYFQAGVLVLNLKKFREVTTTEKMLSLASERAWRCQDQDVLNMICKDSVYYLSQEWNVIMNWQRMGQSRMQIMELAPRQLFEEYVKARENLKIAHFAGLQKPWECVDCDLAEYFWHYARLSVFYEKLLLNLKVNNKSEDGTKTRIYNNASIRKSINKIFPIGTRRREVLKLIAGIK